MADVVITQPPMPPSVVAAVYRLEEEAMKMPQVEIHTEHAFHAGMYARTIKIPAGVALTGALIKIPTILIVAGDVLVYTAEGTVRWTGYHVMLGPEGRKQAFVAIQDTFLTMLFPTEATTVEEAEAAFTDEADRLLSRRSECQAQ